MSSVCGASRFRGVSARARAVAGVRASVYTCSCAIACVRASRVSDTSATTRYVRGSSGSMNEGADSVTRTREDSLKTSSADGRDAERTTGMATPSSPPPPLPPPPPPTTTYTARRPRFGTGGTPPSPYMWIDGRQLRSALAWTKKWPTGRPPGAVPLRVSFPVNDNHLVTGYLEPANPWRHGEYSVVLPRYILGPLPDSLSDSALSTVSPWSVRRSASCVCP